MNTKTMFAEYQQHNFISHPKTSSIACCSSVWLDEYIKSLSPQVKLRSAHRVFREVKDKHRNIHTFMLSLSYFASLSADDVRDVTYTEKNPSWDITLLSDSCELILLSNQRTAFMTHRRVLTNQRAALIVPTGSSKVILLSNQWAGFTDVQCLLFLAFRTSND